MLGPTAHALSTTGFAGSGLWFSCSKASDVATKNVRNTCINKNLELGATSYSSCYTARWFNGTDGEGTA